MYVDYNSGIYDHTAPFGYRFGPDWIGTFAQYTRRQAGYYPEMNRSQRRTLEIAAHAAGYQQQDRYMDPKSGRAYLRDWQRKA
jgi:hypothetical protein